MVGSWHRPAHPRSEGKRHKRPRELLSLNTLGHKGHRSHTSSVVTTRCKANTWKGAVKKGWVLNQGHSGANPSSVSNSHRPLATTRLTSVGGGPVSVNQGRPEKAPASARSHAGWRAAWDSPKLGPDSEALWCGIYLRFGKQPG